MKAIVWKDETHGRRIRVEEIPEELKKKAAAYHQILVETVVENDDQDELMHKYIEGEDIGEAELKASLRTRHPRDEAVPGDLRNGLQEQGRAAAAGCGGRLPAFAAGCSAGEGHES